MLAKPIAANGINVMTYDLSDDQDFHECPTDQACTDPNTNPEHRPLTPTINQPLTLTPNPTPTITPTPNPNTNPNTNPNI